ncbi:MAG: TIGR03987 family protein [Clostridia bacterium]|nr:TIGR03987 family protein [Clostridia bacterium]
MGMNMILAIVGMFVALGFYTYAVLNGRKHGLHIRHLMAFGLGLALDYLATMEMNEYAIIHGKTTDWHNFSGYISLWGMAFHFLLAVLATLFNKARVANCAFHRVSLVIYIAWLFAFITGAVAGFLEFGKG